MVRFDCGELVRASEMALMAQPYVLAKGAHSARRRPQAPLGPGETSQESVPRLIGQLAMVTGRHCSGSVYGKSGPRPGTQLEGL